LNTFYSYKVQSKDITITLESIKAHITHVRKRVLLGRVDLYNELDELHHTPSYRTRP